MVFGNCGVLTEMGPCKSYVEMTGIDAETSQDIAEVWFHTWYWNIGPGFQLQKTIKEIDLSQRWVGKKIRRIELTDSSIGTIRLNERKML